MQLNIDGYIATYLEPVVPSQTESESRVDKASGISSEARWEWEPCSHLFNRELAGFSANAPHLNVRELAYLSERSHDQEIEESDESIADKERSWTGLLESLSTADLSTCVSQHGASGGYLRANNQASTDCTTNCDHSNLARAQVTVKMVVVIDWLVISHCSSDIWIIGLLFVLSLRRALRRVCVDVCRHFGDCA